MYMLHSNLEVPEVRDKFKTTIIRSQISDIWFLVIQNATLWELYAPLEYYRIHQKIELWNLSTTGIYWTEILSQNPAAVVSGSKIVQPEIDMLTSRLMFIKRPSIACYNVQKQKQRYVESEIIKCSWNSWCLAYMLKLTAFPITCITAQPIYYRVYVLL